MDDNSHINCFAHLQSDNDLDDLLNQPLDPLIDNYLTSWASVNTTINPEQLTSSSSFGETKKIDNVRNSIEQFDSLVLSESQPSTQIHPKPGKRLSLASLRVLNKWLSIHTHHPYPTVAEVESIMKQTGLTKQQVLNWFANARRRKKFERLDTTDHSSASSEASPRDIPAQRPPTPFVQQSPFERWRDSPPEDEPSCMAAIAQAASGALGNTAENGRVKPRHAPSVTGSWATSAETSDSSRSSNHSAYSNGSGGSLESFRRITKRRRRAGTRGRNHGSRQLSQVCHRFQCTFCTETFKLKHTWARHERTQHLSLEQWECSPFGPTIVNEQLEQACVYCGSLNPDAAHLETHNHEVCHKRERSERVFYRKDHLRQHLRLVHGSEFKKWPMEDWRFKYADLISRCGFCDDTMATWSERASHLAEHFKEGMTMADWKGNWGFDASTLEMVENSMPPCTYCLLFAE